MENHFDETKGPKLWTDATESPSPVKLLWADVSHRCIIDAVADEATLDADVCHAWERLVGGSSGL